MVQIINVASSTWNILFYAGHIWGMLWLKTMRITIESFTWKVYGTALAIFFSNHVDVNNEICPVHISSCIFFFEAYSWGTTYQISGVSIRQILQTNWWNEIMGNQNPAVEFPPTVLSVHTSLRKNRAQYADFSIDRSDLTADWQLPATASRTQAKKFFRLPTKTLYLKVAGMW